MHGPKVGIALNPSTSLSAMEYILDIFMIRFFGFHCKEEILKELLKAFLKVNYLCSVDRENRNDINLG